MSADEINLRLTIDDVNVVLEGLGAMPYQASFAVVGKIQDQAHEQLSDEPEAARLRFT